MFLKEFLGNAPLVRLLRQGGLPPAALFAGPSGVGKKTLALLLAGFSNCLERSAEDLCGRCPSCVKARGGNHPDILLFTADSTVIGIDAARRLSREAQYRPFQGTGRFFVVDEAERLSAEAANALLKTLEEPPETSHIVLVTAHPELLLPTVLSRCQKFTFQGLARREIAEFLRRQADLDNPELRAALSGGSLAAALVLDLEQTLQDRDWLLRFLSDWKAEPSFRTVYRHCEAPPWRSELRQRDRVRRLLELLEWMVCDLYFLAVDTPERAVNQDCLDSLRGLQEGLSLDWMHRFLYHIGQAKADLERYVSPQMCFETLWLEGPLKSDHAGTGDRQVSHR